MKPLNLRGIRKINSFEDVVDGEGRRFIVIRVE